MVYPVEKEREVDHVETAVYRPRLIDQKLVLWCSAFGAVSIAGPRGCGKTRTAMQYSKSCFALEDPTGRHNNRKLADLAPSLVLDGETPRLLDEWQLIPKLWDAVRLRVDQEQAAGLFLLTNSVVPNRNAIQHSGIGRISRLRMRPMSLYESGDSSGEVSLKALCHGEMEPALLEGENLRTIVSLILRGGWPANLGKTPKEATFLIQENLNAVLQDGVDCLDGVRRDIRKMRLLLRALARSESTAVSARALGKRVREADGEDLDPATLAVYLDIFQRLYLTDNQLPFLWNIGARARSKQAEKRHLADPSLACALLEATPESLLGDLTTLSCLFEALCERDLRIYAEAFDAALTHYQNYGGQKIDAVIELRDNTWCAFQIRLGYNQVDEAAASLLKIKTQLEKAEGKPPAVLGVICGLSSAAYQRPDGVFVVPITALKP